MPLPTGNVPPATISVVGAITPDDSGSLFRTDDFPGTPSAWIDFELHNRYENDKHVYMTGLTSPNGFQGASVAFFQLAAPTLLLISDWTTSRWGTQPQVPDPNALQDSNWVLLDAIPETVSVLTPGDGATALYRISGTYVYGHKNPRSNVFSHVNFGRPPWLDDTVDRRMPASKLKPNLIDSGVGFVDRPPAPGDPGGAAPGKPR